MIGPTFKYVDIIDLFNENLRFVGLEEQFEEHNLSNCNYNIYDLNLNDENLQVYKNIYYQEGFKFCFHKRMNALIQFDNEKFIAYDIAGNFISKSVKFDMSTEFNQIQENDYRYFWNRTI